jgi:NADH-quinone oxidoreductase subunit J
MVIGVNVNNIVYHLYQNLIIALIFLIALSIVLIVVQTNPVYAVFSFIYTALLLFLLLILMGAEFFAIIILIIYTGVITVLFIFVVIMYNFRIIELSMHSIIYNPLIYMILIKIFWFNKICSACLMPVLKQQIQIQTTFFTLDVVQFIALFNDHYFLFIMCGLLIFIAMVGSIVITYPFYKHSN